MTGGSAPVTRLAEVDLAALIDIAGDAIIVVDEAQRIVVYNQAAERMFGWTKEELVGKSHDVLLPERFRPDHARKVDEFVHGTHPTRRAGQMHATVTGLRKNGEEFQADAAMSVLNAGGRRFSTVVMRDITAHMKADTERAQLAAALEQERTWLRALLDNVQTGLLVFDAHGELVMHNARTTELLGADPSVEFVSFGTIVRNLDGTPMSFDEAPSRRALRGETVLGIEYRYARPDGTVIDVIGGAAPMFDVAGHIVGVVSHVDDITDVKRRERRAEILASVGEALSAARGRDEIVSGFLRAAIPAIADGCVVMLLEGDLVVPRGVSCVDPERERIVEQYLAAHPGGRACGVRSALRERRTVFFPEIHAAARRGASALTTGPELFERIGATSCVTTALLAHGEPLGTLSLFHTHATHRFEQADVVMVESLARLFALALQSDALLRHAERAGAAARVGAERLEAALDSIEDAVAIYDETETLILCNQPFRALLVTLGYEGDPIGLTRDALVRLKAERVVFADEEARSDFLAGRLGVRVAERQSSDLRLRDGRILRSVLRHTPNGVVQTIWDLTADIRREDELRDARVAAEAASAAKSEFLASMSHELRTPLNAILGFAQLLRRDRIEPLSKRHRDRLDQVLRGGEHLLRLIDDILDLSRIEAGGVSMSPEAVDVAGVLREVEATLEPVAAREDVTFDVAPLPANVPPVRADRTRFAQILLNFGSNAIKYNRAGGTVSFVVSYTSAAFVRVTVADTGIGIPVEKQASLFQPFQRAGQETGPIEGTGIGLVISERLAALMGGRVGFRSTAGEGSEFWVDIPVEHTSAGVSPPSSRNGSASPNHTVGTAGRLVLCIEDNPASMDLMIDLLGNIDGITLITATNASDGIARARDMHPAAIIMDINLPDMSGFDALGVLRKLPETRDVPVIAVTAAASERDRLRGEIEFFRYLTKPVDVAALESAVAGALGAPP